MSLAGREHAAKPKGPAARVLIATPCYGGINHRYVESLTAAWVYCLVHGVEVELKLEPNACLIQYARNALLRDFLHDKSYTHIMWIDADVGFDPRAIIRLLEHDKDVVGGVYPMKTTPVNWPYSPMDGEQSAGLHRAKIMPGGFLLCSRRSMEAVAAKAPSYWHHYEGMRVRTAHVFDVVCKDETLFGEDIILSQRLYEAGFEIWCDPDINFRHSGPNEWRGNLKKAIESMPDPLDKADFVPVRDATAYHEDVTEALARLWRAWQNDWAVPAPGLFALVMLARRAKTILETGSGLSSLVMAAANPSCHVHALEVEEGWARRIETEAKRLGIENLTVHRAPLEQDGFYSIPNGLPAEFDLVCHDGPVRQEERPIFFERFASQIKNAAIFVDDQGHYSRELLGRYRYEVIGDRYAVCVPKAMAQMATSTAA